MRVLGADLREVWDLQIWDLWYWFRGLDLTCQRLSTTRAADSNATCLPLAGVDWSSKTGCLGGFQVAWVPPSQTCLPPPVGRACTRPDRALTRYRVITRFHVPPHHWGDILKFNLDNLKLPFGTWGSLWMTLGSLWCRFAVTCWLWSGPIAGYGPPPGPYICISYAQSDPQCPHIS